MDSVGFDVNSVLSHELQDIFNASSVGQTTEAYAVASAAGCWKERRCCEDWDRHDWRRGQCGDQRCGHVAVQNLESTDTYKTNK